MNAQFPVGPLSRMTAPPAAVNLVLWHEDIGVDRVIWRPDGSRPDQFVVVRIEDDDGRWSPVADVVVAATQKSVGAANRVVTDTLCTLSGSAVVAVGVRALGCLLRHRTGDPVLIGPGDGSSTEAALWAALSYIHGHRQGSDESDRRGRASTRSASSPAIASAFGSPLSS